MRALTHTEYLKIEKLRYMPTLGHMRNIFQEVLRQGIMQLMTGLQGRAGVIYVAGMKRLIKWFATTSKTYYSVFVCEEHGTFKGKLKVKHNDNGLYYDVRIVKQTDEKGVDKIIDKQVKEREHRRRKRLEEHKRKKLLK